MEAAFNAQRVVRERQTEIVASLVRSAVPFALSGSNATFAWISEVDPSAVRQYRNIEIIISRDDADRTTASLSSLGLTAEVGADHILFRNVGTRHVRWADKALFSGEIDEVRCFRVPGLQEIEWVAGVPIVQKDRLVYFQLARWNCDDRVDIRDMIEVGIVDDSWLLRLPNELAARLQELLDNPDG